MEEYRLAKGWRIITYCISLVIITVSVCLLIFSVPESSGWSAVMLILVALGMIVLFVYAMIDAYKSRFIIAGDYVIMESPFGIRTLKTDAIRGFRKDENYIHILPKEEQDRKIKVSTYYGQSSQIVDWLAERYDDLDVTKALEEHHEILKNPEFGLTEEMRERRLQEARKAAKYINYISWGVLIWLFFYPSPYAIAVSVAAIFPLVVLVVCYSYRGFMKGDENENSVYPSVGTAFALPSVVLMLRAILDFNILKYENGWVVITFMTVTLYVVYMLATGGFTFRAFSDYVTAFLFPIITFCYSFGTCIILNCQADPSAPAYYRTVIESKRISNGRRVTFHLKLSPWAGLKTPEEVKVSHDEYEYVHPGDSITILQRDGYLRLPWIEVRID